MFCLLMVCILLVLYSVFSVIKVPVRSNFVFLHFSKRNHVFSGNLSKTFFNPIRKKRFGASTECRATFLGLSLKWLCGSSV